MENSADSGASSRLLVTTDTKSAARNGECRIVRRNEIRKHSTCVCVMSAGVTEDIVFFAVAVEVENCLHPSSLSQALNPSSNLRDLGMKHF